MNSTSNVMAELGIESGEGSGSAMMPARPMYWSIQRELWENRSLSIAPVVVAAFFMFGFLINTIGLPRRMRALAALDPARQRELVQMPFNMVAGMLALTAIIVGAFYCLDALHGERRDRSILFWKSLPVSDRTAVLAKASIPLVVLPLFTVAIIIATRVIMLLLSTMALSHDGAALATLWKHVTFFQSSIAMLYGLIVITLWLAPTYCWLLLLSIWARRAVFLWAVLPSMAISMMEKIAFGTTYFAGLQRYLLIGWFERAFDRSPHTGVALDPLTRLTPATFFITPGLWIGFGFAAAFLATAIRLRRSRQPI